MTLPRPISQQAMLSMAGKLLSSLAQFAISVVLARLLIPEVFGLVGMVTAVTTFASVLVEFGLGPALIQRKELEDATIDGCFTLTALLGLAASGVIIAMAPAIGGMYGRPILVPLARMSGLAFLVSAVSIVPRALLLRRMEVAKVASVDLGGTLVGGLVSVSLAAFGMGVWSLVIGPVVSAGSQACAYLWLSGYWPRFRASIAGAKPLMRVSGSVLAFSAVNYWARWADNFVIGVYLGERELGFYMRAYTLMLLPLTQITGVLANTMLPAMSRLQDDPAKAREVYLRAIGLIALVSFPLMCGVAVMAVPLVSVLYGAQWAPVAPMLMLLAPVGALQSVMSSVGWIYMSRGRTGLMFKWGSFTSLVYVSGFVAGASLGSGLHVAAIYLAANVLLLVPGLLIAGRLIGVSARMLIRSLAPLLGCAVCMSLVVAAVDAALLRALPNPVRLACGAVLGAALYVAFVKRIEPPSLRDGLLLLSRAKAGVPSQVGRVLDALWAR